jgi:hypothetical protein
MQADILIVICTGGVRHGACRESYRRCRPLTKWAGGYWSFCKAVRVGKKTPAKFKLGHGDDSSEACFPIRKLSNKLSTGDGADAAHRQLTRQVHQGHILTLWDTR